MNQSIKAKILPLFPILDLNELRRETHLEDAVLSDFSVGWDQNVYLLFKQMAESQDKITAKPPAGYTVVELRQHRRTRKRKGPAGRFHPAGHIYAIPSALQPH